MTDGTTVPLVGKSAVILTLYIGYGYLLKYPLIDTVGRRRPILNAALIKKIMRMIDLDKVFRIAVLMALFLILGALPAY